MSSQIALVVLSAIVSIFTLAAIGGNDVANSQGTAVGSGALSMRGAQILAGICEFAGAALVGGSVSNTIGSKMVDSSLVTDVQYCWGMFSGLLSVGIWMVLATKIKMPVSATHSIIGALFGLNLVMTNWDWNSIDWAVLGKIAIAWIVTPLLSFGGSYASLVVLNIYWPSVHDRDAHMNESQASLVIEADASNRSSLLSFVMAPPGAHMTPIPTPSPKRLGSPNRQHKMRLTWAAANESVAGATQIDHDTGEEIYEFKPAKFKFAVIFGILMATLVVFIMIGGPKSINIEDGAIEVEDWVIVVISFASLIFFTVIGYLIEGCYRRCYVKYVYRNQSDTTDTDYESVELANKKRDSQQTITPKPTNVEIDNFTRKSEEIIDVKPKSPKSRSVSSLSQHSLRNRLKTGGITNTVDIYGTEEMENGELKGSEQASHVINTEIETNDGNETKDSQFNNQDYFRLYLIIASGSVAFAHGGNDVANVLGPFGQIYKYATTGDMEGEQEIPIYVSGGAGIAIALGFALWGAPVLETIGKSITKLSYRSGFTAQFCSAATVLVCNVMGLPVSSSTVIVGGVSGVGLYNSKYRNGAKVEKKSAYSEEEMEYVGCWNKCKHLWQQKNIRILCKILAIWIITIPANAAICGGVYALINLAL